MLRDLITSVSVAAPDSLALLHVLDYWKRTGRDWLEISQAAGLVNALQGPDGPQWGLSSVEAALDRLSGPEMMPGAVERNGNSLRLPTYMSDLLSAERRGIPRAIWQAAIYSGSTSELAVIGHVALVHNRNDEAAESAWRKAAESGCGYSVHNLGILLHGRRRNRGEAVTWLTKAVEAGYSDAREVLASVHLRAASTRDLGLELLRQAAREGSVSAMLRLGDAASKDDLNRGLSFYGRLRSPDRMQPTIRLLKLCADRARDRNPM